MIHAKEGTNASLEIEPEALVIRSSNRGGESIQMEIRIFHVLASLAYSGLWLIPLNHWCVTLVCYIPSLLRTNHKKTMLLK